MLVFHSDALIPYTDHPMPLFNLICSDMLWKRRIEKLQPIPELGFTEPMDLTTELGRHKIVRSLVERTEHQNLTGREKNKVADRLARGLAIDYSELTARRLLELMSAQEVAEIASDGVDVQLHTHRHRTPEDETRFRPEIADNRQRIQTQEAVLSATTCDAGLATQKDNPFFLSRFIDTSGRTPLEFESWLTGLGAMLAVHRAAP